MTHSDLERMLEQEGRELLRRLCQAHLDVRGIGEVRGKVVGADGVERNQKRLRTRQVTTLFGTVTTHRIGYSARGYSSKRMSEVAAVYTVTPFVRTAEDIVKDLGSVRDAAVVRPRPEHKRVWASLEKSPEQVLDEAMQEASSRDKTSVALVDGNETQLRILRELSDKYGVKLTIVVDTIHVPEYLWKATYAFNAEGSEEAQAWVTERLFLLLHGKSSLVAAGIRCSATLRDLTGSARAAADDCADYLLKYGWSLRYDDNLALGFPLSTGVIEGACRYLVKDRMDITGACWSLIAAEVVLKLRSLYASADFDQYRRFHEQRAHERSHQLHYAGPIPAVAPPARRRDSHLRIVK